MNKICTLSAKISNSNKGLGYTSLKVIGMFKKPTPKFYNKIIDEFVYILDTINDTGTNTRQLEQFAGFEDIIISRFCDICFDCDRDNTNHHALFESSTNTIQISVMPVSKLNDITFEFIITDKSDISNKYYYLENLSGIYNKKEDTYKM